MRRHLPPLNALVALESVVRTGSVGAAASELLVTHGAVSKQLGVLESWAGIALFESDRKRLRPTAAAKKLAYAADRALDMITMAAEEILAKQTGIELHVVAPATFAMRWLIPRLPKFHALNPGLSVSVRQTEGMESWTEIPFDVAIRRGEKVPSQFRSVTLLEEMSCLAASPKLLDKMVGSDIEKLPLLESESRRGQLTSWLEAAGLPASLAASARKLPHLYIAVEAALSGDGALVVPINALREMFTSGALTIVRPEIVLRGPNYTLAYNERLAKNAVCLSFIDWILGEGQSTTAPCATPLRPADGA
jgi:LysR family transcriptional regulator, glycine cleavage system transcriptional activator